MKVGAAPPRRGSGAGISTGRMTPSQALEILQGPRQEELQRLLDAFHAWGGYVLAHHSRSCQFGAFALFIEERGMEKIAGVAGGEEKQKEDEHA